jgi:hypothetical protein
MKEGTPFDRSWYKERTFRIDKILNYRWAQIETICRVKEMSINLELPLEDIPKDINIPKRCQIPITFWSFPEASHTPLAVCLDHGTILTRTGNMDDRDRLVLMEKYPLVWKVHQLQGLINAHKALRQRIDHYLLAGFRTGDLLAQARFLRETIQATEDCIRQYPQEQVWKLFWGE